MKPKSKSSNSMNGFIVKDDKQGSMQKGVQEHNLYSDINNLINLWELWVKEWTNAHNFFKTKGNIKTKCKLKKKWHDDFMNMFKEIEVNINNKNNTNYIQAEKLPEGKWSKLENWQDEWNDEIIKDKIGHKLKEITEYALLNSFKEGTKVSIKAKKGMVLIEEVKQ